MEEQVMSGKQMIGLVAIACGGILGLAATLTGTGLAFGLIPAALCLIVGLWFVVQKSEAGQPGATAGAGTTAAPSAHEPK
jgi:hypothetical protein